MLTTDVSLMSPGKRAVIIWPKTALNTNGTRCPLLAEERLFCAVVAENQRWSLALEWLLADVINQRIASLFLSLVGGED